MYRCMLNKDLPPPVVVQVPLEQYLSKPAQGRGRASRSSADDSSRPEMGADFVLFAMDLKTAAQARGLMAYGTPCDIWDVVARHVTLAADDPADAA